SSIVQISRQQLGQTGRQYTEWYGVTESDSEWSGCFVSWCANEAGYVSQGLYPRFSNKDSAIKWFKENGLWDTPNVLPNPGNTVFLDFENDGICDTCGIVSKTENGFVYYIRNEGNIVNEVRTPLAGPYSYIMGYGVLPQMSGLRGETVEEQCYNYLRQDGYSEIAAIAVLANFQGECSCDPGIYGHDYGDAAGIMQWTGTNKTIFMNWCAANAMDWRKLETQLMFFTYWLDIESRAWGDVSPYRHPDFQHVYNTSDFKKITADQYNGDIAKALYEATVMFTDDLERPTYTWSAETRRYTYSVQFYNYLVAGGVDGTTQSAWRSEYANDIGVFHLN
ncbi:MAG: hypothetical protein II931_00140, partial [Clostridia bacterium]|nr:hypothetical protein [Clostridia bacterium]